MYSTLTPGPKRVNVRMGSVAVNRLLHASRSLELGKEGNPSSNKVERQVYSILIGAVIRGTIYWLLT